MTLFPLGTNLYALVDVDIRLKYLPAVCCSWLDETKLLVGYASGQIKIWNIQNQECLTTINEDRVVLQTVQTPTGDAFVTAGNNAQIYIYSIHTLQKIMTMGLEITFLRFKVNYGNPCKDLRALGGKEHCRWS